VEGVEEWKGGWKSAFFHPSTSSKAGRFAYNLGVRRYAHMPTPRPLWLRLRRCLIYTGQACLVHITYVFASKVNRQLLVNGNKSGCDPVPIYTESLNENT
jgi:hypothetical protein